MKGEFKKENHFIDIETIFPSEEDLKLINELNEILKNVQENIPLESLIKAIIKFLSAPIIIDEFENHK